MLYWRAGNAKEKKPTTAKSNGENAQNKATVPAVRISMKDTKALHIVGSHDGKDTTPCESLMNRIKGVKRKYEGVKEEATDDQNEGTKRLCMTSATSTGQLTLDSKEMQLKLEATRKKLQEGYRKGVSGARAGETGSHGAASEFGAAAAAIRARSPQATVSLEDRLTAQEVQMTEVLQILRDHGAAISEMAASLTTEPPERQRLYPRLHEGNDRQGFASTKSGGRVRSVH
ncbi:hypothetical protein Sjap_012937 [Stephania japonica]|uniref:Uncharacterized protein n=1 Tax=Stephania japonica TaxID=461633 RepID=A0AAP0IXS8_9MAGN